MSFDGVPWRVREAGRFVDLKHVNLWLRVAIPAAAAQVVYVAAGFVVVQTRFDLPQSAESAIVLVTLALWALGILSTGILAGVTHGSIAIGVLLGAMSAIPIIGLMLSGVVIRHGRRLLRTHGVEPGLWGAPRRAFERRWARTCHRCGYDLSTTTLTGGVCPECGPPEAPSHRTPKDDCRITPPPRPS